MGAIVEIEGVNKIYGTNHVVKDLNLTVEEGEFLTLLGSSGCGKTTTLRMIAGFEEPTSGSIKVEGEAIGDKEPFERNVNTVFQSYALFPHKTIYDNVAYGLKMKKVPKAEIKKRVTEMLALVQLEGFEKRYPSQLSGGQKQRVAIAGVLAMEPEIIVLDEPTAMLDPGGRQEIIDTVRHLNREREITVVLITHYMDEAAQADRIIVMNDGEIAMEGTPSEIFPQVDRLRSLGLDTPQATELAYELNRGGFDINTEVLSVDKCAEEILRLWVQGETE